MWRLLLIVAVVVALLFTLLGGDKLAHEPAGQTDTCKGMPGFVQRYSMKGPQFDTSDRAVTGLKLSDGAAPDKDSIQLPSWKKFGSLGPLTRDDKGTIYTANIPLINTISAPAESHLAVLKLNPDTGVLDKWITLKGPSPTAENYYGITSLAYDCATKLLYAASLAGSTEQKEAGFIAVIDPQSGQEKFRLKDVDALSLVTFGGGKGRHLYVGSARHSTVVRYKLTDSGKPFGEPEELVNFDEFNRTRARELTFAPTGLTIRTTNFYFNLIASTEFDHKELLYTYDPEKDAFTKN
jgi:hypothetical protein